MKKCLIMFGFLLTLLVIAAFTEKNDDSDFVKDEIAVSVKQKNFIVKE